MIRFEILFKPGYFKVCLWLVELVVRLAETTFTNGDGLGLPLSLCQLDLLASLWFKYSFEFSPLP